MWNPKSELAKKAHVIASKKYPHGYNKAQLIECSREVYGGWGKVVVSGSTKTITTYKDVDNANKAMANIDGNYPLGMSTCEVVGLNGGCGQTCPAYLDGTCDSEEMTDCTIEWEDKDAQILHLEIYGEHIN